ncbi:transmembrane protein 249 isoform X2 [Folsomia candida]|uniref:Uncharacterized protein n=1 Tax=Folsomia candida TaxID=158441 RepID=A0A226DXX5_FOLCA|nr:transmembrane protein 249 isoform X2 [Folsomia candida]OXA50312.1 hypothetical protein Fcan01_15218 [Folsomia candida]
MFRDDTFMTQLKYWRSYKPEEELYVRLKENPVWPFKSIGDGYFYVSFRSDRVEYGIAVIALTLFFLVITMVFLGPFSMAFAAFSTSFIIGCWTLHGKFAWRELIVSRRGKGKYIVRVFQNEEILFQSEIRNVYIRLIRKIDALGDPYFSLILGGYEIDDHRITRMTKAEGPLRIMGMRIASRVGINFFDWKDESEEHLIWHFKTYSKIRYKTDAQIMFQKSSTNLHSIVSQAQPELEEDTDRKKVKVVKTVKINN